ncbi:YgjV family protein [Chloroflexota bacterium]
MADVLAYFGGSCLIVAMFFRNVYVIKSLMLITAISFLIYGIILQLLPIILLNAILICSGIFALIRRARKDSPTESTG